MCVHITESLKIFTKFRPHIDYLMYFSGGFGATSQTTNLFGSATPSTQSSGGLFGNTSTSAFGTPRPAFGGFNASTPGTGLFGQTANTGTGMFGSQGNV